MIRIALAATVMTVAMAYSYASRFGELSATFGVIHALALDLAGPLLMAGSFWLWASARRAGGRPPALTKILGLLAAAWSLIAAVTNVAVGVNGFSLASFLSYDADAAMLTTPFFTYATWFIAVIRWTERRSTP